MDILNKIEALEAEIDTEEEKYNKKIQDMKEKHRIEMDHLKENLSLMRKELKN